jgi:hypothetical protein
MSGGKFMSNEKVFDVVKEYISGDVDKLSNIVSACNSYDSGLEDYYYWNNDSEFYDTMFSSKEEVARAVYYASNYCYMDAYITLNAYGNCETISEYEYRGLLKENEDEIIEAFVEGLYEDFGYFIHEIDNDNLREEIERFVRCGENE